MIQLVSSLVQGFTIGAAVAMPIGLMGILRIQRTLDSGLLTGLATGFGAATIHILYSTVAITGFAAVTEQWLEQHAAVFCLLSGIFLLWFVARAYSGKS